MKTLRPAVTAVMFVMVSRTPAIAPAAKVQL